MLFYFGNGQVDEQGCIAYTLLAGSITSYFEQPTRHGSEIEKYFFDCNLGGARLSRRYRRMGASIRNLVRHDH